MHSLGWPEIFAYFFAVSAVLSVIFVFLCRRVAMRLGVVDAPRGDRKTHGEPTALLGGLGIFLSFGLVVWAHLLLGRHLARDPAALPVELPAKALFSMNALEGLFPQLLTVFGGAVLVVLIGLWDDFRAAKGSGLSVRTRLGLEFLVAGLVVSLGLQPELYFLPTAAVWLVAVVWIVAVTNAFNMIDGMDGLASGVAMIAAALLGVVMFQGNQPLVSLFLVVLAGVTAGFWLYNFPPASIFLGSAGSLFLGYMLAVTVLVSTFMVEETSTLFPILVPVLVLGVPLYDLVSVMVVRLVSHRSVTMADRSHFHHRLLRMGFSKRQAVLFIYLVSFCVGINATLLVGATEAQSLVILAQIAAIFLLLVVVERVSLRSPTRKETPV